MKQKIKQNFDIAFNSFFDEKRTPECDKIYNLIPSLVMYDQGKTGGLKDPLLSEVREHVKKCSFCEHEYNQVYEEMNAELTAKENDLIQSMLAMERSTETTSRDTILGRIGKKISETVLGQSSELINHLGSVTLAFASTDTGYEIIRDQLVESKYLSVYKGEVPGEYTFILKAIEGYLDGYYSIIQGENKFLITLKADPDINLVSGDYRGNLSGEKLDIYNHSEPLTPGQVLELVKKRNRNQE